MARTPSLAAICAPWSTTAGLRDEGLSRLGNVHDAFVPGVQSPFGVALVQWR